MSTTSTPARTATHPLDRLSAEEIELNRAILDEAGLIGASTRFPLVQLDEPAKAEVVAWTPGTAWDRRVRSVLLERGPGTVTEVLVSLDQRAVLEQRVIDVLAEGQPPIMGEEFELVEQILWADEAWCAAMAKRGLTTPERIRISALSAGHFEIDGEDGRRLVRCLSFLQLDDDDNIWAHPIDGIVAYVDLNTGEVIELIDAGDFALPTDRADFEAGPDVVPERTTQKPIVITQPEGASFTVEGDLVRWENWEFRIGFDQVEGLTLHQIGFRDRDQGGRVRPIVYRASVAEMVVPYGDPSPVRFWQNYFDAGEYSLGKEANSLSLGCDCLGEIHYFDAVLADDDGRPRSIGNAICMHEEDFGVLWKHTDAYNKTSSTRRQRRLVISFFITVGNYDYGFYWYLYLDGTIELECKATGVVFASSYPGAGYPWASEIGPGIGAPYHQHLFSARLDLMIDGVGNAVDEVDAVRVPVSAENPYGNAFTRQATRLQREGEAARMADGLVGRTWHLVNPSVKNGLGQPVGYALHPEGQPTLLADPSSSIAKRAAFTTKHLWVTAQADEERYPSGRFVNQNPGLTGIDTWAAADRDIDGTDIVVWHTFGLTHFPRPEDWPIMPVDYTGFTLKPVGFFDRNPALDVPRPRGSHCDSAGEGGTSSCH